MNSTDNATNYPICYSELCETIATNLSAIMEKKGLTQKELSLLCAKKGARVSQATISNLLNASHNCSLSNLVAVCNALDISLDTLMTSSSEKGAETNPGELFIIDPSHIAFKGYLKNFQTYFYQTTGKNSDLLHGTLSFCPSKNNKICEAKMSLFTGDILTRHGNKHSVTKEYTGQLIISPILNSAYCFLYSNEISEICFLTFHHFYLLARSLKCVMADAVTTSAGSNKRPTVHRVCICDSLIDDSQLPYIKGQLLLNDAEILISSRKLEAFKKDPRTTPLFNELLDAAVQSEHYHSITEAKLAGNGISEEELFKLISLLRTYSAAPKYNKVSRKTDEALYSLLENKLPLK